MSELGRILIADDEVGFAAVTADLLREEGYFCDCAEDAYRAKALLSAQEYDLLIADIKMPGNDGLELVESVSALAESIPVILVTGYPTLDTAIKSTRLSVAGYLVKPTPFEDLLQLVREAVMRAHASRLLTKARNQLEHTQQELNAWGNLKNLTAHKASLAEVDHFLHHAIHNIIANVTDLRDLTQALAQNRPKQQVCQLLNCPRQVELTQAITEAVSVLEKTKNSFKSKELAALRIKLETALKTTQEHA